ncbi:hypothetical protein PSPO01_03180 [Paraphaeosphaeria sporulosa]
MFNVATVPTLRYKTLVEVMFSHEFRGLIRLRSMQFGEPCSLVRHRSNVPTAVAKHHKAAASMHVLRDITAPMSTLVFSRLPVPRVFDYPVPR